MDMHFLPLTAPGLPLNRAAAAPAGLPLPQGQEAGFARILQQERTRALDGSVPAAAAAAERAAQEKDLRAAAQGLEAMMINQMFSAMRKSVPKSELFDGGMGEEVFKGMLDQEYSGMMSKTGSLGLADIIVNQMRGYIA